MSLLRVVEFEIWEARQKFDFRSQRVEAFLERHRWPVAITLVVLLAVWIVIRKAMNVV